MGYTLCRRWVLPSAGFVVGQYPLSLGPTLRHWVTPLPSPSLLCRSPPRVVPSSPLRRIVPFLLLFVVSFSLLLLFVVCRSLPLSLSSLCRSRYSCRRRLSAFVVFLFPSPAIAAFRFRRFSLSSPPSSSMKRSRPSRPVTFAVVALAIRCVAAIAVHRRRHPVLEFPPHNSAYWKSRARVFDSNAREGVDAS